MCFAFVTPSFYVFLCSEILNECQNLSPGGNGDPLAERGLISLRQGCNRLIQRLDEIAVRGIDCNLSACFAYTKLMVQDVRGNTVVNRCVPSGFMGRIFS